MFRGRRGFTIVELLIVIVVIAILAAISVGSYVGIQSRAMDTRIISIVDRVGGTIQIADITEGRRPSVSGYFQNTGNGTTTFGVDQFVTARGLPSEYRAGVRSSNVSAGTRAFRYYSCGSEGGFVIYASLNSPSPENIQGLQAAKARCGHTSVAPETGTERYNYARIYE